MHEYYQKSKDAVRKTIRGYISPIAKDLEQDTGEDFDRLFEEVWGVYERDMLERFPYIGGDKASGTRNLTGAYGYVALGEVLKTRGISIERWGYLITVAYERFFSKLPSFMPSLMGHLMKHKKLVMKMLRKKDEKNRKNNEANPGSFQTRAEEGNGEYDVIYNTTFCPLAAFAEKYGYMEYMPYLCNLDYAMFSAMRIPFYRTKTIASGDDVCNFCLKSGAPIVPPWPCHAADPDDPLK